MYMVTKRVKFLLPCDIATGFKVFGHVEFDVPNGWTAIFDNKDQAIQLIPDPHSGALSAAERETAKLMAFIRDVLPVKYRTSPSGLTVTWTWVDYIIAAAQRLTQDVAQYEADKQQPDYARGVLKRFFKDEKNRVFHTYTALPVDSDNVGMAAVQIMEALNEKRKEQRLKIERLEARIKWMEQGPTYEFADETNTKLDVKWDFGVPPAMHQIVRASTGKYRVTNIEWVPDDGVAKVSVRKRHIETAKAPFTMPPPSMECGLNFVLGNGLGRCRRPEGHPGPHSQAPDGPPPPPPRSEFVDYGVTPLKPFCRAFIGPGVVGCNKSLGHVGPCGIE